jgi:hypothetical protein
MTVMTDLEMRYWLDHPENERPYEVQHYLNLIRPWLFVRGLID